MKDSGRHTSPSKSCPFTRSITRMSLCFPAQKWLCSRVLLWLSGFGCVCACGCPLLEKTGHRRVLWIAWKPCRLLKEGVCSKGSVWNFSVVAQHVAEIHRERRMSSNERVQVSDWDFSFPPLPCSPMSPCLTLQIFGSKRQISILRPRWHKTTRWGAPRIHASAHPHLLCNLGTGDQIIARLAASNILGVIYGNRCLKHSQPSRY